MNKHNLKSAKLIFAITLLFSTLLVFTGCEDAIVAAIEEEVRLAGLPDYTLTINNPSVGSVTPSGIMSMKGGEALAITATVPGGYTFVNWQQVSGSGNVTFDDDTSASTNLSLSGGDATINATIISLAAPTGSISIDGGATTTSTVNVDLALNATDNSGSGIDQMLISNQADMSGATWENYATTKAWTLAANDGTRTVYVKFRDNNSNESIAYSDTIVLDRGKPNGSIVINGGALGTNLSTVSLTIAGVDATSAVTQMRYSNVSNFSGASWGTFNTSVSNWSLSPSDGPKTVYLQVRDAAGNTSSTFSDTIIYDTTGPVSGSIAIRDGDSYWDRPEPGPNAVFLNISAVDAGVGNSQIMIANNASFTGAGIVWENYTTTRYGWDLEDGYGVKTVYIKFRDSLNNESSVYSDTIKIDDSYEGVTAGGNGSTSTAYSIMHQGWTDPDDPPSSTRLSDQELSGYGISNDSDYYVFEVGANSYYGLITATVTDVDGSSAGLTVRIYSPSGWSSSTVTQTGSTAVATVDPSGDLVAADYYVIVSSNNGFSAERYDLRVEFGDYSGM